MDFLTILGQVPLWAWLVLGFGLFIGFSAMRTRTVPVWMLALAPVVFWALSVSGVLSVFTPVLGGAWLLTVLIGMVTGWLVLHREPLEVNRGNATLRLSGTWTSLVLFLVLFVTRFYYTYTEAVDPALAQNLALQLVVFGLSGWSTGAVTGRTARLYYSFLRSPRS